jgi:hypothetical protein
MAREREGIQVRPPCFEAQSEWSIRHLVPRNVYVYNLLWRPGSIDEAELAVVVGLKEPPGISKTVCGCVDGRIGPGMAPVSLASDAEESVHMFVLRLDPPNLQTLSPIHWMKLMPPGNDSISSVKRGFLLYGSRCASA